MTVHEELDLRLEVELVKTKIEDIINELIKEYPYKFVDAALFERDLDTENMTQKEIRTIMAIQTEFVRLTCEYPRTLVYEILELLKERSFEDMSKNYDGDTLEQEPCCKLDTDKDGDCPAHKKEVDPYGKDQHELGAKVDAGKVRVSLLFNDFPRALLEVAKISTFGANKYAAHSWLHVPNGIERYDDAKDRHILYGAMEDNDPDSGLLHLAHEAWNVLAKLELIIREMEKDNK